MAFHDARSLRWGRRRVTGERVIGFMSGNQHSPDIMSEAFILAASDLIDQAELPVSP
jgi:hypothetical protein